MHLDLAYIDAGSGSLIIQAVIATIVAVPFFFRHQIGRLSRRLRGRETSEDATEAPLDGPDRAG